MLFYVIGYTVLALKVAIGLGFVIFVHELGHFAVAKLCGVKCEKFYLGFDIAGLKLCKFRWGETEYGIGILPLGGYVKMLGQEDNPAKLREEIERAKRGSAQDLPSPAERGAGGAGTHDPTQPDLPSPNQPSVGAGRGAGSEGGEDQTQPALTLALSQGERGLEATPASLPDPNSPAPNPALFDPRSYLAKSVPKRMAIIAAGVVMNVIFAFLMAVVAFSLGVEQLPCVIGEVVPGDPAWQAGLRVGDEIVEVAGKRMKQFRDLTTAISLGDIDPQKGVPLVVRRPGVEQPLRVTVKPDRTRGAFFIGVTGPAKTTRLAEHRETWVVQNRAPVLAGSVADLARPAFRNGDNVVEIDDVPIETYAQIHAQLAQEADRKVTVTVEEGAGNRTGAAGDATQRVSISVARNPMRALGLVMEMGPITAVQTDSPAAAAGITPGDMIAKIDGEDVADPMVIPDRLRRRAGETIQLTIRRKSSNTTEVLAVQPRQPLGFSSLDVYDCPLDVAPLGVAYHVLNSVRSVAEGSPAAGAGMRPGDVIVKARLMPPEEEILSRLGVDQPEVSLSFAETDRNWPALMSTLQKTLPGTKVELTFLRHEEEQTVTLEPVEATDWFNPDRGLVFEPMTFPRKAETAAEAFAMGGQETLDALTIVFRSLKKIGTNQVSPRSLAGPWWIVKLALQHADQGTAKLLLFLTMLSANLAVLNFMPIPVLDGGHMMFLAYEGIRGKPANEHVQMVLTYIGLGLILALMTWVIGLDTGWISRR